MSEPEIKIVRKIKEKEIGVILSVGQGEETISICKYLSRQEAHDHMMDISRKLKELNFI